MIKSPLRYPGGKSKAIEQILPLIPHFEEFREPFVGGSSVFLTLKQLFSDRKYWINNLYLELYKFREYS
jgi:DNA adenine methylase